MKISEQLREAIRHYDSVNSLAEDSGVSQSSLQRFVAEERGLAIENVDRLCEFFGLELTERLATAMSATAQQPAGK